MGIGIAAVVGGWAMSAVGLGSFAGALGGVVASAVGGAIIGATIGGLSAAVMGGDIGEGVLFGAVGGAVLGGVGAAFDAAAGGMAGVTAEVAGTEGFMAGMEAAEVAASMETTGVAGGLVKDTTVAAGFTMKDAIGYVVDYKAGEEAAEEAAETREQQMVIAREQMASAERIASQRAGGSGSSAALQAETARRGQDIGLLQTREQIAEQRRQFDTTTAMEKARRERRATGLAGATAAVEAEAYVEPEETIDEGLMKQKVEIEQEKEGLLQGGV